MSKSTSVFHCEFQSSHRCAANQHWSSDIDRKNTQKGIPISSVRSVLPVVILIYMMAANSLPSWKALQKHAQANFIQQPPLPALHLRNLLKDESRAAKMQAEFDGTLLDYSRSKATLETVGLWLDLAKEAKVEEKIQQMAAGEICNVTEQRQVLHAALRCSRDSTRFSKEIVGQVRMILISSSRNRPNSLTLFNYG